MPPKPFSFIHFHKNTGWTPCFPPDAHLQSPVYPEAGRVTNHKSLRLTPLDATLTSERAAKSFSCNTYKKHTGGRGDGLTPQVTGQTSQLTAQKVSITSFQFRVSTFGLLLSGGPYFPEGPSPKARE